jgi:xylose isomerase
MSRFFGDIAAIRYEGPESDNPLAFHHYDKDRIVLGKRMEDLLRFAVCYWHSFAWQGNDPFGGQTLMRPWFEAGDPLKRAELKLEVAFDFFATLGAPFFTFHDRDVAPEGADLAETNRNLLHIVDLMERAMERTGRRLLWGGREGYETLLNTDLKREADQLGRFMTMVVEHKHRIGFGGTILIEPKPYEPTKHQYDRDTAAVLAFLQRYGLAGEIKVNIEVNHATLAGLDFAHEIAFAAANGILGSIDANAGDDRLGWDLDRFPTSVDVMSLGMYEILKAGGLTTGGFNFDAHLRRQSVEPHDLFHAHIGAIDVLARSLLVAARMIEEGTLQKFVDERYSGWNGELGRSILDGKASLPDLRKLVIDKGIDPAPGSGRQERLEYAVNAAIDRTVA